MGFFWGRLKRGPYLIPGFPQHPTAAAALSHPCLPLTRKAMSFVNGS